MVSPQLFNPVKDGGTLTLLDTYLHSPAEMMHAIDLLLQSELFTYHDARMVGIMMVDAQEVSCQGTHTYE